MLAQAGAARSSCCCYTESDRAFPTFNYNCKVVGASLAVRQASDQVATAAGTKSGSHGGSNLRKESGRAGQAGRPRAGDMYCMSHVGQRQPAQQDAFVWNLRLGSQQPARAAHSDEIAVRAVQVDVGVRQRLNKKAAGAHLPQRIGWQLHHSRCAAVGDNRGAEAEVQGAV